jgi:hypothetical protein
MATRDGHPRHVFAASAAASALLIGIRNPAALLDAAFWAEDGSVFFADALRHGWHSIYMPVYGYLFALSRLIAFAATFFPVVAAPYIYSWTALALNAIAVSYFARDGFAWLLPDRRLRLLVCALLITVPGAGEVMMNQCNLMTPLTLLGLLLILEVPTRLSGRRLALLAFLAASAGPMFLLFPVVAYLFWRYRDSRHGMLLAILLAVFVVNAVGNHITGAQNGLLDYGLAVLIPQAIADNLSLRLLLLPFVGNQRAGELMSGSAYAYWLGCLLGAAALVAAWHYGRPRTSSQPAASDLAPGLLLLAYACVTFSFAAIAVSRSYAAFQVTREAGDPLWHMRYAFLPGALALLTWGVLVARLLSRGPVGVGAAVVGIVVLASNQLVEWGNVPPRRDGRWRPAALEIQSVLHQRESGTLRSPITMPVPVNPPAWNHGVIHVTIQPRGAS